MQTDYADLMDATSLGFVSLASVFAELELNNFRAGP